MTLVPDDFLEAILTRIDRMEATLKQANIQPPKEWLTIGEFAELIGKSTRTVKRRIDAGELQTRNIAGVTMVRAPKP